MFGFLPSFARGIVALFLLALNTLFWCTLLFAFALVKLVLPFPAVRRRIDPVLNGIATLWIACNSGWMRLTQRTRWDVQGVDALRYEGWYLVNCNHQSWADIFVLQHLLNRRIPMLKFFLKQQLIYVPVIGLAWWALDFPFMKRHGKAELRKRPELRGQDAEATRRACEKFALVPTSVMNFAEGTRFTAAKHRSQASPYRHLLKPKAGALALALNAMGEHFQFADRRDHRLSRRRAQFLGVRLRQGPADRGACARVADSGAVLYGRLLGRPGVPGRVPALAGRPVGRQGPRDRARWLARDGDAIVPPHGRTATVAGTRARACAGAGAAGAGRRRTRCEALKADGLRAKYADTGTEAAQ